MTRTHRTHSALPDPFQAAARPTRAPAAPPALVEARKEEREASNRAALLREQAEEKSRAAEESGARAEAAAAEACEAREAAAAAPSTDHEEAAIEKERQASERNDEAQRCRKEADEAEKRADAAARRAKQAAERRQKLEKEAAVDAPIDYDYLKDQWKKVAAASRLGSDRAFLRIQVRTVLTDPVARRALERVRKKNQHDEDDALGLIRAQGLATEISNVTKRLNQMAMSETRRLVLAATYADTLYRLIAGGHDDAADTLGFTSAVLHDQESGDDSPLARFAAAVVDIVLTENAVKIPKDDFRRDRLIDELRATF